MGFIPSGDDDDEGENDAWVVGFGWTLYALAYLAAVLVAVRVVSKQIDYGIAQVRGLFYIRTRVFIQLSTQ